MHRLRVKLGADGLVAAGTAGTAVALLLYGIAREPLTGILASLLAGMSWIAVPASLNVSAQVALTDLGARPRPCLRSASNRRQWSLAAIQRG